MSFILTATGREYRMDGMPCNPGVPGSISIDDIGHHLAMIPRFCGATAHPYSVAEHSLLVRTLVRLMGGSAHAQMAALMHDAHEAFINDLSTPVKDTVDAAGRTLTGAWRQFERTHANIIRAHFGLRTAFGTPSISEMVKTADLMALALEREYLTAFSVAINTPWDVLGDDSPDSIDKKLAALHDAHDAPAVDGQTPINGVSHVIDAHFSIAFDRCEFMSANKRHEAIVDEFIGAFQALHQARQACVEEESGADEAPGASADATAGVA